jgi:hypothetical protein
MSQLTATKQTVSPAERMWSLLIDLAGSPRGTGAP